MIFRYVGLMEGDLHDNLTLYQRTEDGKYSRRFINNKHRWKDVYVYPHLYGELSQHEKGFQALVQNGFIFKMIQVSKCKCNMCCFQKIFWNTNLVAQRAKIYSRQGDSQLGNKMCDNIHVI